jgi:hypothetical protein
MHRLHATANYLEITMPMHVAERTHDQQVGRPRSADAPRSETTSAARDTVPLAGLAHGPAAILRQADPADVLGGTAVGPDIATMLARRRGRGERLPDQIARSMGEAMGADLSDVRVHTGTEAAMLARSVQATAFTHGADIYFGERSYSPGTVAGQRLLAHELAHTQQTGGSAHAGGPVIGRAADPAEADADRVADGILRAMRRQTLRRQVETDLARPQPRLVRRTALRILRVLARDAVVVRGGTNLAEQFTGGSGVTSGVGGKLTGVSVNSGNAKTFEELCAGIPNGSVGRTTVGAIRDLTGDVVEAPTRNLLHCLASGLTGDEFSGLFTPIVKNPAAVPRVRTGKK